MQDVFFLKEKKGLEDLVISITVIQYCDLNGCVPTSRNSYLEVLMPNVMMVLGGRGFEGD